MSTILILSTSSEKMLKFVVLYLSMTIAFSESRKKHRISWNLECEIKNGYYLDCARKELQQVPNFERLKDKTTIKEINLSYNNIQALNLSSFEVFPRLKTLYLSGNKLTTGSLITSGKSIKHIQKLYLNKNLLTHVPVSFLKVFKNLKYLNIRKNLIKVISNDTFKGMEKLENVDIFKKRTKDSDAHEENSIQVEIGAFRHMKSLKALHLDYVDVSIPSFPDLTGTSNLIELTVFGIKDLTVPDDFCDTHRYIDSIAIGECSMASFPTLSKCKSLQTIEIYDNKIGEISAKAFSGLPYIRLIEIFQLQNEVKTIHSDAFSNMSSLVELDLSHFALKKFPNLKGTTALEKLSLPVCSIETIPEDFCDDKKKLINLDLNRNKITKLPSLTNCSQLVYLDLYKNRIKSLTNQFNGLKNLEFLKLTDNHLTTIPESMLGSMTKLHSLHLADNMISHIDDNAFKNITNLVILDVSNNKLRHLPHKGLQSVTDIKARNNKQMIQFPTQQELPHVKRLQLDYHYHCCFFLKRIQQIHRTIEMKRLSGEKSTWKVIEGEEKRRIQDEGIFSRPLSQKNDSSPTELVDGMGQIDPVIQMLQKMNNHTTLYFTPTSDDEQETLSKYLDKDKGGYCTPTPNDFYPCEDLMGKEWLRVCVWIVFFLALLGNITVLLILFFNYSKLDVPRYLIMNLSFADLCLGIYLGFLAFVDIKTIGDFREHALNWQFSGSCKFAGFLAVFSSELSVYTLTMITIERFLTIKNSMYVDKRISRHQAFIIMSFGWLFSLVIATLPLFEGKVKFNDYTKYSVCLPFETETLVSRIYLMFLLGLNLLAFVIILFCYVKVYLFIRGSNAWNSGDSRVARRMAILVFTDFICWFPIALVALSAVFKNPFVTDLWISKVITIFIFPLNACANPFLYAIFTKQFRKDLVSASRHLKDRITNQGEIRKSLLKLPIKGSLTYSTSVRRGSSCSFLFGRRLSAKPDVESKRYSRNVPINTSSFQQSFEEPDQEDFQERLTSV